MALKLKKSIFLSTVIHLSLLGPAVFMGDLFNQPVEKRGTMVVDYVIEEAPHRAAIAKRGSKLKIEDTPKVDIKNRAQIIAPAPVNKASAGEKDSEMSRSYMQEMEIKQEKIKSTKDYINYYQFIREKIRRRLKHNYRSCYKEGNVYVIFVLNSSGSLANIAIEHAGSTNTEVLHNIATNSVKDAAPFPPFPKAVNLPKMIFNLEISFKKQ